MSEWNSATVIVAIGAAAISLFSAGASIWAALVSHRMLKRQRESDKPSVTCRLEAMENDWLRVVVILENPTTSSWVARRLTVLSPKRAVVASESETHTPNEYNEFVWDTKKLPGLNGSSVDLSIDVMPVGSAAGKWSGRSRGDQNWGKAYLRPPTGTTELKMELLVESLDGIPRREKYRIIRKVGA